MNWTHAAALAAAIWALGCFTVAALSARHGSWPRRRNRFRRVVLPRPHPSCVAGESGEHQALWERSRPL